MEFSLFFLSADEIVRRLLQECLAAKETDRDAVIGEFLGKHGNSGRVSTHYIYVHIEQALTMVIVVM